MRTHRRYLVPIVACLALAHPVVAAETGARLSAELRALSATHTGAGQRVVIDAVASGDPARLRADLEALGLENAASWGVTVSGQLPVAAIPALEDLQSLRFARKARATTHGSPAGGTVSPYSSDGR